MNIVYALINEGASYSEVSKVYGKHRHFAKIILSNIDIPKFLSEDPREFSELCVDFWWRNYSYEKIAELTGLELPTVCEAVDIAPKHRFSVARRLNKDVKQLDKEIAKCVLIGEDFTTIGNRLGIDTRTVQKYFIRFFRSRFKISDLERT